MWWWLRVLLLTVAVAVGPCESPCDSDQYELHGLCCDFCPAGSHVSRVCDVDRVTECSPCEPGSFMAHRNRETACLPCAECREGDQELVSDCAPDSNRRCQCKTGSFYCDSEDCVETCYRCSSSGDQKSHIQMSHGHAPWEGSGDHASCLHSFGWWPALLGLFPSCGTGSLRKACPLRCDGPTLEACNATRDTICATEPGGSPRSPADLSFLWAVAVPVTVILTIVVAAYCRGQGVQLPHLVVRWLKHESRDSGGLPQGGTQHVDILLPGDAESSLPAPGTDSTPLLGYQGTAVAPSEDPERGVEPQAVVATGDGPTPEQALQTQAPVAPGDPDGAAAPLHVLEQQYEQKYVLKDKSPEATNRIYFEFGQEVPTRNWRMFMRFAGLEENDIVLCEHENPGNAAEQRHGMLLCWQSKLGRAASPFRLLAALCRMRLRECLENVINKLLAEGILGSKDAEPPN